MSSGMTGGGFFVLCGSGSKGESPTATGKNRAALAASLAIAAAIKKITR